MRELKFRIRDMDNNVIVAYEMPNGKHWQGYLTCAYNEIPTDNIQREQYTGMKDKNGVEIYDGDIVHYTYLPGKTYWNYEGDAIIEWNDISWWLKPLPGKGGINCAMYCVPGAYPPQCEDLFEIIGNIYQNLELL